MIEKDDKGKKTDNDNVSEGKAHSRLRGLVLRDAGKRRPGKPGKKRTKGIVTTRRENQKAFNRGKKNSKNNGESRFGNKGQGVTKRKHVKGSSNPKERKTGPITVPSE